MLSPDALEAAAERLLAVSGLFPTRPLGVADAHAAEALPREWRRQIRRFFDRDHPAKFTWPAPPSHKATLERLVAGIAHDEGARLVRKFADADISQAYLRKLSDAREFVRSIWPALKLDTAPEPDLLEPGPDTMGRVASIYLVIDRPARMLEEIAFHTLLPDQVSAFKLVYPTLHQLLIDTCAAEISARHVRMRSYRVPWPIERVLRVLLQLPAGSPLTRVTQAPPKMAAAAPVSVSIDFKGQQTKAQQLDQR